MELQLEPVEGPHQLAESRLRQILGDYARSMPVDHASRRAMEAEFPREQRHVVEEAPFLSLYGWSALAFDHDDLRGVYVLGDPEVLEPHLVPDEEDSGGAEEDEPQPATWRARLRLAPRLDKLRQALRRSEEGSEAEGGGDRADQPSTLAEADAGEEEEGQDSDAVGFSERVASALDWVQRAVRPVTARLGLGTDGRDRPGQDAAEESEEQMEMGQVEEVVYLLAYRPDVVALHSTDGMARLPGELIEAWS